MDKLSSLPTLHHRPDTLIPFQRDTLAVLAPTLQLWDMGRRPDRTTPDALPQESRGGHVLDHDCRNTAD